MSKLDEFVNLDKNDEKKDVKAMLSKEIFEWIVCVLVAVVLALFFRYFIGTPTKVQSISMNPTLIENDTLILNRLAKTFRKVPNRGDIVTFEAPSVDIIEYSDVDFSNPVAIYDNEPRSLIGKFFYYGLDAGKKSYIKRVIALPGEHLEIKNNRVYINGDLLDEPYLDSSVDTTPTNGAFYDLVVPNDCIFAMGDNRPNSKDCRVFGCIPISKLEGEILFRFWPLSKFGKIE